MTSFPAGRYRRVSGAVLVAVLVLAIVLVLVGAGARHVPATVAFGSAGGSTPPGEPEPVTLPARWPERLTLLTDSVGVGAVTALRRTMAEWRVRVLGRPALMLDDAASEVIGDRTRLEKVVVVALGYNSLWERGREDFEYWSGVFDRNARRLVRTIHGAGGRKIVWVLLRDAPRSSIPKDSLDQHRSFAWYFPWVNHRLRILDRERTDLVLADWSTIGDAPGLTYDAIHLDPDGAARYASMVKRAIVREPYLAEGSAA